MASVGSIEVEVVPDLTRLVGALEELVEAFRHLADELDGHLDRVKFELSRGEG